MAKKIVNVAKNQEDLDTVPEGTQNEQTNPTAGAEESATSTDATIEETTVVPSGSGEGEDENAEETPEMDRGAESEAAGEKRDEADVEIDNKREEIAKEVFSHNMQKTILHFTSDLIPFFDKSDALKHARSLSDETVVTINKK